MERCARVRQYILRLLLLQGGQGGAVLRVKRFVVQNLLRRLCVCRIRLKRRVIRQKRQLRIIRLIVQQVGQQRRGIIRVCPRRLTASTEYVIGVSNAPPLLNDSSSGTSSVLLGVSDVFRCSSEG